MKAKTDIEACDLLDRLVIASPCSISWESMKGDDKIRSCSGCSRNVYNISAMSKTEANEFLHAKAPSGSELPCLRFYRRQDGTIMTDDCPRALRKIRDTCRLICKIAAGLLATVFSLPCSGQTIDLSTSGGPRYSPNPGNVQQTIDPRPNYQLPMVEEYSFPIPASNKPGIMEYGTVKPKRSIMIDTACTPASEKPVNSASFIARPVLPKKTGGHAEHMSTDANELFQQGLDWEKKRNKILANMCYRSALAAFNNQTSGDPNFRLSITDAIARTDLKVKDIISFPPGSRQYLGPALH